MVTFNSTAHREAIWRTLAHHAGGATDSTAIAEATLSTWHQVTTRLAPIIGGGGVDVLFRRSLHLTTATFTWLPVAAEEPDGAALLAGLGACLANGEAQAASEAAQALFVTFYGLLASMLGESLTRRLLDQVWTLDSASEAQESTR